MPRFVILRHDSPRGTHFDLMLERDGTLKTWALPQLPEPGLQIECEALPNHRIEYLDYQGPVSGDRGAVIRADHGLYTVEQESESALGIELVGQNIPLQATLRRCPGESTRWIASFSDQTKNCVPLALPVPG